MDVPGNSLRAQEAAGLHAGHQGAGHSLRAGFVTQAHLDGASQANIMATTGHRNDATVRRYIRHADPYTATPHVCRAR